MTIGEMFWYALYGVVIGLGVGWYLEGKYGERIRLWFKTRKTNKYIACYNRQISASDSKSWNCYGAEYTAVLKDCAHCPYLAERMKIK